MADYKEFFEAMFGVEERKHRSSLPVPPSDANLQLFPPEMKERIAARIRAVHVAPSIVDTLVRNELRRAEKLESRATRFYKAVAQVVTPSGSHAKVKVRGGGAGILTEGHGGLIWSEGGTDLEDDGAGAQGVPAAAPVPARPFFYTEDTPTALGRRGGKAGGRKEGPLALVELGGVVRNFRRNGLSRSALKKKGNHSKRQSRASGGERENDGGCNVGQKEGGKAPGGIAASELQTAARVRPVAHAVNKAVEIAKRPAEKLAAPVSPIETQGANGGVGATGSAQAGAN